jgi:hypothetical protein
MTQPAFHTAAAAAAAAVTPFSLLADAAAGHFKGHVPTLDQLHAFADKASAVLGTDPACSRRLAAFVVVHSVPEAKPLEEAPATSRPRSRRRPRGGAPSRV